MAADILKLEFKTREGIGTPAVKRLRAEGIAPGTIYGLGNDTRSISVETLALEKIIQGIGGQGLIDAAIDGADPEPAMIVEIQRETITRNILHFDMKWIDVTATDTFSIRVEFVGEAEGIKAGGVLNAIEDTIEIECLPTILPDKILIDISALEIGDALFARDASLPEDIVLKTDAKRMLVNIAAPAAEEEPEVPEEEEVEGEPVEGEEGERVEGQEAAPDAAAADEGKK